MKGTARTLDDWLSDIEQAAAKVVTYTSPIEFERFKADEPIHYLVIKMLENMGEATRNIARLHPDFQATVPDMPWREMAQLRNRLSHGYFDYSPALVWRIAVDEVPGVLERTRRLIADRAQSEDR